MVILSVYLILGALLGLGYVLGMDEENEHLTHVGIVLMFMLVWPLLIGYLMSSQEESLIEIDTALHRLRDQLRRQ